MASGLIAIFSLTGWVFSTAGITAVLFWADGIASFLPGFPSANKNGAENNAPDNIATTAQFL